MKTILLIALAGLTTLNSYAYDHHKKGGLKGTAIHVNDSLQCQPLVNGDWSRAYIFTEKEQPCFQYWQNNVVVTQCPGTFLDNWDQKGDNTGYEKEKSFTGYYPVQNGTTVRCLLGNK